MGQEFQWLKWDVIQFFLMTAFSNFIKTHNSGGWLGVGRRSLRSLKVFLECMDENNPLYINFTEP